MAVAALTSSRTSSVAATSSGTRPSSLAIPSLAFSSRRARTIGAWQRRQATCSSVSPSASLPAASR